ncbi:hypothetical protein [Roseicyclus marinus]|uniref:hypothetical protein n=1 Tax=Roseicyclus marinus TaxID=2161673 RepID=UPI00240FBF41|nr:hypothetical protein [Roseicyclus marinus]MDG3043002.1 hypothetical protein [Roseicyclus marinus]
MTHDRISVREGGQVLTFSFSTLLSYHGGGFPGGVVHALKAMQAGFPALGEGPLPRRDIHVLTAFTGPGGRDAVECVTRALTDGRYSVDRALGGKDVISDPPGPYVWRFTLGHRRVAVTIRPGHVRPEFVSLGAMSSRTAAQDARLEILKHELADRLLPLAAQDIYEVRPVDG